MDKLINKINEEQIKVEFFDNDITEIWNVQSSLYKINKFNGSQVNQYTSITSSGLQLTAGVFPLLSNSCKFLSLLISTSSTFPVVPMPTCVFRSSKKAFATTRYETVIYCNTGMCQTDHKCGDSQDLVLVPLASASLGLLGRPHLSVFSSPPKLESDNH